VVTHQRVALASLLGITLSAAACGRILGYDKDYVLVDLGTGGAAASGGTGGAGGTGGIGGSGGALIDGGDAGDAGDASDDASPNPCEPAELAHALDNPRGLVVAGPNVFVSDNQGVYRIARSGGPVVSVASGPASPTVVAGNGRVYWNTTKPPYSIQSVDELGGDLKSFDTVSAVNLTTNLTTIAVDATHLYWIPSVAKAPFTIGRTPLAGGAPEIFAGDLVEKPRSLASTGVDLYWGTNSTGEIFRRSTTVVADRATVVETTPSEIRSLIVDADTVYWTSARSAKRHFLDAGDAGDVTTFWSGLGITGGTANIVLAADQLYWTFGTTTAPDAAPDGSVFRVTAPTAPVNFQLGKVADALANPRAVAVDEACVYWVEADKGLLKRMPR